jgi:dihydrolipoamide dehydrogenase
MQSELVVIGGGPGGYAAAFRAADVGMQVTMIDERSRLGGECLLQGCIPSKALLHVARVIAEAEEAADWGVEFASPVVDLEKMRQRKEKVISTLSGGLKQLAKRRGVKVIAARATFVDSKTVELKATDSATLDEDRLTFDHAIIATGSRATMPPIFQLESPRVMDSSGALALAEVPSRLLVVGGGYIGLEMGTVYARLGSQVTVVEMTSGLLPGADRDLVKPLQKRLQALFAEIRLETKVISLVLDGDEVEAMLEDADGETAQRFDAVLVAVGRRPNSADLGLEKTDTQIDEHGFVIVDEHQRTADPHILAVGDVAGEPMLAHKATHEGKVAVAMIRGETIAQSPASVPAVVFTDPEIAWTGLTADEAKRQGREVKVAQYPWAASGRAQAIGRTEGLTKLILNPETDQVLGVGLVGVGAGELIAEGVLAIERSATASEIAHTIHPHPTMSETLAGAAEIYLGVATEVYRPRRERKK